MSTSGTLELLAKANAAWVHRKTRQITLLEEKLWEMERRPYPMQWLRRIKLKRKVERLKAELAQPMLLPPKRSGG